MFSGSSNRQRRASGIVQHGGPALRNVGKAVSIVCKCVGPDERPMIEQAL